MAQLLQTAQPPDLDVEQVVHIYQVRGALDALAARLAAEQRFRIDVRLLDSGRKAAAGNDVEAMVDADLAFHTAIYSASGNPLIAQSARQHWSRLRQVMAAVLQHSRQRASAWDEHEAIAQAIAQGDGSRAARLIEEHSRNAAFHLAHRLAEVLSKPGHRDRR